MSVDQKVIDTYADKGREEIEAEFSVLEQDVKRQLRSGPDRAEKAHRKELREYRGILGLGNRELTDLKGDIERSKRLEESAISDTVIIKESKKKIGKRIEEGKQVANNAGADLPEGDKSLLKHELKLQKKTNNFWQDIAELQTQIAGAELEHQELLLYINWVQAEGYKTGVYMPVNQQARQNLLAANAWLQGYPQYPVQQITRGSEGSNLTNNQNNTIMNNDENNDIPTSACGGSSFGSIGDAFKNGTIMDGFNSLISTGREKGYYGAGVEKFTKTVVPLVVTALALRKVWHGLKNIFTEKGTIAGALKDFGLAAAISAPLWLKPGKIIGDVVDLFGGTTSASVEQNTSSSNDSIPEQLNEAVYYPARVCTVLGGIPFSILQEKGYLTYGADGKTVVGLDYAGLEGYISTTYPEHAPTMINNLRRLQMQQTGGKDVVKIAFSKVNITKSTLETNPTKTYYDYYEPYLDKEKDNQETIKVAEWSRQLDSITKEKKDKLIASAKEVYDTDRVDLKFFVEGGRVYVGSDIHGTKKEIDVDTMTVITTDKLGSKKRFSVNTMTELVFFGYTQAIIEDQYTKKATKTRIPFRETILGGDIEFQDGSGVIDKVTGETVVSGGSRWVNGSLLSDLSLLAPGLNNAAGKKSYMNFLNGLDIWAVDDTVVDLGVIMPEHLTETDKEIRLLQEKIKTTYGVNVYSRADAPAGVIDNINGLFVKTGTTPTPGELKENLIRLDQQLALYPPEFLARMAMKTKPLTIVLTKGYDVYSPGNILSDEVGGYTKGTGVFIADVEAILASTVHHELHHYLMDGLDKNGAILQQWKALNANPMFYTGTSLDGVVDAYGKTSATEDMATVVEAMMHGGLRTFNGQTVNIYEKAQKDPLLQKKMDFYKKTFEQRCSSIGTPITSAYRTQKTGKYIV